MRHKTVLSIFILFFISTLTSAFAEHDGFEGHYYSSKPKAGKLVNATLLTLVVMPAVYLIWEMKGLCEVVLDKTIAIVPVEN